MKNKIAIKIIFLILISLFSTCISKSQCELKEIPFFELNEDQNFNYNLSFKNQNISEVFSEIKISIVSINSTTNPYIKKHEDYYEISLKPNSSNSGKNSFLIVSTMTNGCYDVKKLDFFVYLKPKIIEKKPKENYIEIYETQYLKFFVNATSYYDKDVKTEWYVNGKKQKENTNYFYFFTNYTDKGIYNIEFIVKDKRQNNSVKWEINVKDKNRNPVLRYNIPDFVLTNYTRGVLLNLNDYFQDPDLDRLKYDLFFIDEFNESLKYTTSRIFDIRIKENGDFEIYPRMDVYLKEYLQIKASDSQGLSSFSNKFYLKLASSDNITQIFLNASKKQECKVKIECSEWSKCLPTNIRTRDCYDINNCNGENKIITETEQCDYNATCFDGIKNQDETGVDCGGICEPCPTCNDKIKNQGEEQIDCGGPCEPCPSCFDGIQNQDETDVDCGGICKKCEPEQKCLNHKDCTSFNCVNNICAYPTCYDNKLNQNEEKVDCGGICKPCPTCNDGILNQGEEKIDCGGPCKPCANCFDNIKNQNEIFVDCGGPCNSCLYLDLLNLIKKYYYLPILFLLIVVIVLYLSKFGNKNKITNLIIYSKFFSFLPTKIQDKKIFETTINSLQSTKIELLNLTEKEIITNQYFSNINNFFKELFELEEKFTDRDLKREIDKKILNPFLKQLLLEFYYDTHNLNLESPFFRIELNEKIDHTIAILNKIRDLL